MEPVGGDRLVVTKEQAVYGEEGEEPTDQSSPGFASCGSKRDRSSRPPPAA